VGTNTVHKRVRRSTDTVQQTAAHQPPADDKENDHSLVRKAGKEGKSLEPERRIDNGVQSRIHRGAQVGRRDDQRGQSAQ